MARSYLTWYKTKTNQILKMLRLIPQRKLAEVLNISQPAVNYKINTQYPKLFAEFIQVLDVAGFEIREKEIDERC